jgi:hypothetical protein
MIDSIKITVESKDLEAGKAKMLVDLIKDHKQLKFYQEVDCNENSENSDLISSLEETIKPTYDKMNLTKELIDLTE